MNGKIFDVTRGKRFYGPGGFVIILPTNPYRPTAYMLNAHTPGMTNYLSPPEGLTLVLPEEMLLVVLLPSVLSL